MKPRIQQLHRSGADDGDSIVWDADLGYWVPAAPASDAHCRAILTAVGGEDVVDLGVTPLAASESIYLNGTLLLWGIDYTLTDNLATLTTPLAADDVVVATMTANACGTMFLGASSSAYAAAVLADSPVAYWRCGQASGDLADSSGNGRTMSPVGTPTYAVTGLLAGDPDAAINCDTDGDYFELADTVISRYTSAWTVEAIVKPSGSFLEGAIVTTDFIGGQIAWSIRTDSTAKVQAAFYNGAWRTAESTFDLSSGTIYHLAATWDGTDLKLYIDGTLDATTTPGSSVSSPTSTAVYIGRRANSDAIRHFPGVIDEVAIYDTALSSTRIAAHAAEV